MRLHNIFADQTGSGNLCLEGFFLSLSILNLYVTEKMLSCMKRGLNPTLSYTIYENTEYPAPKAHPTFHVSVHKKSNIDNLQGNSRESLYSTPNCSYIR